MNRLRIAAITIALLGTLTIASVGAQATDTLYLPLVLVNEPVPTEVPPPNVPPTAVPAPTSRPACDPAYPTVCIPSPPPDLDCSDISYRRFRVLPPDPHNFDTDNDGIGCEGR